MWLVLERLLYLPTSEALHKVISDLKIINIRVEKSNFELNTNYSQTVEKESDLDFNVGVLVNQNNESQGIIRIGCDVNTENPAESPFSMEVTMLGEFQAEGKPFKDYVINAISILFPYLRTHINTLTSISGEDPIIIPALNIYELLKKSDSSSSEQNNS